MFVPEMYKGTEPWMAGLMRDNPLALLTTGSSGGGVPLATHLPIIEDPDSPVTVDTPLEGATLLGHLNRANPHWGALMGGCNRSLLVFTGPHTYVSPVIYGTTPAAPTWNFTSVHLAGTITAVDDLEFTMHVVRSTVSAYESRFGLGWDMSDSGGHFQRILPGVGAFRFTVDRAEGMFKLGQEQCPEVRERMCAHFGAQDADRPQQVAEMMRTAERSMAASKTTTRRKR